MQCITSTGILRTHPLPIRGTTALFFLMQEDGLSYNTVPLPLRKDFAITQTDLKLILLQPQPLKCWDYRPAPSCYGIPYSMLHSWYKSKFTQEIN